MRLNSVTKILFLLLVTVIFPISSSAQIPPGAELSAPPDESFSTEAAPILEDEQMTTESAPVVAQSQVKITGTPAILISRPVFAPYTTEEKTMYIAAVSQGYFHFKLSAIPGIQVISPDKIANSIPYFRDYTRRISRNAYLESARRMGAAYLFYQEYEPQGKKTKYNIEFYSLTENQKLVSKSLTINLNDLESGLAECVAEIVASLPGKISDQTRDFLTSPCLGKNSKSIESFGNSFASIGDFSEKRAGAVAPELLKSAKSNSDFHVAKFLASSVCAAAKKYPEAIELMSDLISEFGRPNPSLYLRLASYYKEAGNYNDAMDAAERASKEPSLDLQVLTEKASINETEGDLNKAESLYEKVLSKGGEDGYIYFKLALVNIGLNNLNGASSYLSKAENAGYALDRGSYYDLGKRYSNNKAYEKAIDAFKKSLDPVQDYEPSWQELAKIYLNTNRKADAAECYVNLFQINNQAYKDELLQAAELYEELGDSEKAKDAYALFIARKFESPIVSVKLAKLEAASGNCDKATELVANLSENQTVADDVHAINKQCGKVERKVTISVRDQKKKRSPVVTTWRIASAVLAVGFGGLGYIFDKKVADKMKTYNMEYNENDPDNKNFITNMNEIDKLHTDIENAKKSRNICYAGAAVAGTSLALSITLPIFFSNK